MKRIVTKGNWINQVLIIWFILVFTLIAFKLLLGAYSYAEDNNENIGTSIYHTIDSDGVEYYFRFPDNKGEVCTYLNDDTKFCVDTNKEDDNIYIPYLFPVIT